MTLIPNSKWERMQKDAFQRRHTPLQRVVERGSDKGYDYNDFTQDLFSALYQRTPRFPDNASPGKKWAHKILTAMKDLPEYKQIKTCGTETDSLQSGLGATLLAESFLPNLPDVDQENPDKLAREIYQIDTLLEDLPKDSPAYSQYAERRDAKQEALKESEEAWEQMADSLDPAHVRQALRRALKESQNQIREYAEMVASYGYGNAPGDNGYADVQAQMQVAERIRDNPKLREVAELAGRLRNEARAVQSQKKQPGPDELTDIEIGDDLGRTIPAELAQLAHPTLKKLFAKKFVEKTLIQYKLEENPKEAKGPIVVCLDVSDSMGIGSRDIWSKAIALAMLQIATDQKRDCVVVNFSNRVVRVTRLAANRVNPLDVIEAVSVACGGGTNFEAPLDTAFQEIEDSKKMEKSDIIFITDGAAHISTEKINLIQKAKKQRGTRIYSIVINTAAPALAPISDRMDSVFDLSDTQAAKEAIFSV
jgi:uncharacterized protein with von Willebrand factor type A (vWA) domain